MLSLKKRSTNLSNHYLYRNLVSTVNLQYLPIFLFICFPRILYFLLTNTSEIEWLIVKSNSVIVLILDQLSLIQYQHICLIFFLPIIHTINRSLATGLKIAAVTPVLDNTVLSNCRPISNLPFMSIRSIRKGTNLSLKSANHLSLIFVLCTAQILLF